MANPPVVEEAYLNGECFIMGSEGEVQDQQDYYILHVPWGRPQAWARDTAYSSVSAILTPRQRLVAEEFLRNTFLMNYDRLENAHNEQDWTNLVRNVTAHIRMLCVREGLVNELTVPGDKYCKYNHAVPYRWNIMINNMVEIAAGVQPTDDDQEPTPQDIQTAEDFLENTATREQIRRAYRALVQQDAVALGIFTAAQKASATKNFTDLVCMLAFMFRVRAHHYLPEMEERYCEIWKKCLKPHAQYLENVPFKYLVIDGLHAIFPIDLDKFWIRMAAEGKCAGALIKRVDALPAGSAAVAALQAGMTDISLTLPIIAQKLAPLRESLDQITVQIVTRRWCGSVNHNMYNEPKVNIPEKNYAAMASFIMSCLKAFAPESSLLKSKALARLASSAPISGAVLTSVLENMLRDKDAVRELMAQIAVVQ